MSEERVIRINKILRELNISLDRAVDFLKEKGHEIESSPNAKISQEEYKVLCGQFSADKGNKVASLEVSEEKRKEKVFQRRNTVLEQMVKNKYLSEAKAEQLKRMPLKINFKPEIWNENFKPYKAYKFIQEIPNGMTKQWLTLPTT